MMKTNTLFFFIQRTKNDSDFRVKLFLRLSFVFNLAYATFLFIVSQIRHSNWFFIMSVYYGLLSATRGFILLQINPKKEELKKIKSMKACGSFLLFINLVVSIMMLILIYRYQPVSHHQITVITLATYTFTALTFAIVNTVKYLKQNNHVYSSIKIISLVSASVSLVTLTDTMLATFGDDTTLLRNIILPFLCIFVSVFIVLSAIFMIQKANKDLRIFKK